MPKLLNLEIFNNLLNNIKEGNVVQNFINELSDFLKKSNKDLSNSCLKQENCLYQVVEIAVDGAYLKNINNNQVAKEVDISKETLNKIGNDSVLIYKDKNYIYEEELTR